MSRAKVTACINTPPLRRTLKRCADNPRKFVACCAIPNKVTVVVPPLTPCNSCTVPVGADYMNWSPFNPGPGWVMDVPIVFKNTNPGEERWQAFVGWQFAVGTRRLYVQPGCNPAFQWSAINFNWLNLMLEGVLFGVTPTVYVGLYATVSFPIQGSIVTPVGCASIPLGSLTPVTLNPCVTFPVIGTQALSPSAPLGVLLE